MNRKITSDLAVRTLKKAIASQQEIKGVLILHSDQGILKLFCMRLLKILLIPSTTTGGLIHIIIIVHRLRADTHHDPFSAFEQLSRQAAEAKIISPGCYKKLDHYISLLGYVAGMLHTHF